MATSNQGSGRGTQNERSDSKQSDTQGSRQSGGDTSNRGFASMDPERQREIASEGGRAAHASGNAHEFTSEEARRAGSMSHKNDPNRQSGTPGSGSSTEDEDRSGNKGSRQSSSGGTRGGTPEQHAEAGRQSHKNDDKR
jgi:general stress protein YciG